VTFAQPALATGIRQHWWKALLAVSLALNLCFIAGAVWVRIHPPRFSSPMQRLDQMAGELGLNPLQKRAFEQYAQSMRARVQVMRKLVQPAIAAASAEIASPQADEAKVMRFLDDATQQRHGFMRDMTTMTLAFLSTLSSEQRARFVELVFRQHQRPWAPPPEHADTH
jgi:uncharacterized membrane protein